MSLEDRLDALLKWEPPHPDHARFVDEQFLPAYKSRFKAKWGPIGLKPEKFSFHHFDDHDVQPHGLFTSSADPVHNTTHKAAVDSWTAQDVGVGESPKRVPYHHQKATAPLWHWGRDQTGNTRIPRPELRGKSDERLQKHLTNHARFSQELTRRADPTYNPQNDTILLWRGIHGTPAESMKKEKGRGVKEHTVKHRAVESWSASPATARTFASWEAPSESGLVMRHRVPVTNIFSSFLSSPYHDPDHGKGEAEYIVAMPSTVKHDARNVLTSDQYQAGGLFAEMPHEKAVRSLWGNHYAGWYS